MYKLLGRRRLNVAVWFVIHRGVLSFQRCLLMNLLSEGINFELFSIPQAAARVF